MYPPNFGSAASEPFRRGRAAGFKSHSGARPRPNLDRSPISTGSIAGVRVVSASNLPLHRLPLHSTEHAISGETKQSARRGLHSLSSRLPGTMKISFDLPRPRGFLTEIGPV